MRYLVLLISLLQFSITSQLTAQEVTYTEHIAPIIYNHCTSCHRPGEIGPFSLMNYNQVSAWAPMIAYVTEIKYMPPWKADPLYQTYLRENYLSEEQIAMISEWVDNGTPQGDPALEPELPIFPTGSQVGEPDLIVSFAESYQHPGTNLDVYRYFALPTGLTEDKDLIGLELRPGNATIVHHALLWEDTTGSAAAADAAEEAYGYTNNDSDILLELNNQLPGYVPGQRPVLYSHGMGQKLHAGGYIKIQMHYGPSPVPQQDSTTINLFFSDQPTTRPVRSHVMVPFAGTLTNGPFVIFPNQVKTFHGKYTVPVKVSLLNVFPHMHYLGKDWEVFAITPQQDTINIIKINDWDFDWQGYYSFKKPLVLPAGTIVHGYATYDNTANNPSNPNNPPQTVTWGENTDEEMYYLGFSYVFYQPGDEHINFEDGTTATDNQIFQNVQNKLYPIYPNPADGRITIGYTLERGTSVSLYISDMSGKTLKSVYSNTAHYPGMHSKSVDVSNLPEGIYIVIMQADGAFYSQKIMIHHKD